MEAEEHNTETYCKNLTFTLPNASDFLSVSYHFISQLGTRRKHCSNCIFASNPA
jgi:hypothetical protein